MRKFSVLLFSCMVVLLILSVKGYSEEVDCLQCHPDLREHKVIHPALDMGCTACHAGLDVSDIPHKVTNGVTKGLMAEPPDLCFNCHDQGMFSKKSRHPALDMGCTSCHDPHSSDNEKMLISSPPDLCYNCHDNGMFSKKVVHPALQMGCTTCHDPHSSDAGGRMLLSEPPDLCFNCHDQTQFSGEGNIHPPVAAGMCTSCHNPHSESQEKLLLKEPPDLCFNCHDRKIFEGDVVHTPVQIGMCTTCHNPHKSKSEKLLQSSPPDLCFNCHDSKPFTRKNVHPPVAAGMCTECHQPHAGMEIKLLKNRPIRICLKCHRASLRGPHAVLGFSGSGGHFVGDIRKKKKPVMDPVRTDREFYCGSCHDPHSSDWGGLFRYKADSVMALCSYCHKY